MAVGQRDISHAAGNARYAHVAGTDRDMCGVEMTQIGQDKEADLSHQKNGGGQNYRHLNRPQAWDNLKNSVLR
jgi:hypothetical protein